MATVDQWDTQEGYISQGRVIGFITLGTAAVAGENLTFVGSMAAGAQNKIIMMACVAGGDEASGVGVCLKGGVTGDKVPVCFYGVVKMCSHSVCTVGGFVTSGATVGTTITYAQVVPLTAQTNACFLAHDSGTGTAFVLGQCLQAATTAGNELLVLIGSGH